MQRLAEENESLARENIEFEKSNTQFEAMINVNNFIVTLHY